LKGARLRKAGVSSRSARRLGWAGSNGEELLRISGQGECPGSEVHSKTRLFLPIISHVCCTLSVQCASFRSRPV